MDSQSYKSKFHGNSFSFCWDISLYHWKVCNYTITNLVTKGGTADSLACAPKQHDLHWPLQQYLSQGPFQASSVQQWYKEFIKYTFHPHSSNPPPSHPLFNFHWAMITIIWADILMPCLVTLLLIHPNIKIILLMDNSYCDWAWP